MGKAFCFLFSGGSEALSSHSGRGKGSYRLGRQAPHVRVFRLSHGGTAFHSRRAQAFAQVLANIVRELKLDPADVLMVGDASTDRDAAEEVGTQFYGRGPALRNDGTFPWEENLEGLSSWIGSHVR